VAKYGTKAEEHSNGFNAIFKKVCKLGRENDTQGTNMAKSLFTKVTSGRELGMQETAHLLLSLPLVKSSVSFSNVNLKNLTRRIQLIEDNDDNDPIQNFVTTEDADEAADARRRNLLIMTIIDAYGDRFNETIWH
jgi:RNA 3'-terminal phosphate cyclase